MATIIAKNLTAGDLSLTRLSVADGVIPASSQVTLTTWNNSVSIQNDTELRSYIDNDQVILNVDGSDLTKEESQAVASPLVASLGPDQGFVPVGGASGPIVRPWATHPSNEIVVSKSGGDYTSIKTACDSITDASSSNPYTVLVSPGEYTESPFTIPSYVTIKGKGHSLSVSIDTNDNNNHFISLEAASALESATITGPTGTNFAAVNLGSAASTPAFCENVSIKKGYFGLRVHSDSTVAALICSRCSFLFGASVINRFMTATGNATLVATECSCNSPVAGYITYGFYASGSDASIRCLSCVTKDSSGTSFYIDNGANANLVACDVLAANRAIHIGSNGSGTLVEAVGTAIHNDVTTSLKVDSLSGVLRFQGSAPKDSLDIVTGASAAGILLDSTSGEEGTTNLGELYLGEPGSTIPLRSYGFSTFLTGHTSGGVVTRGTGRAVDVTSGDGFINSGTTLTNVSWDAVSDLSVPVGEFWVYVNSSGTVSSIGSDPGNTDNILLASGYAESSSIPIISKITIDVRHSKAASFDYAKEVIGNTCVTGCSVSKSTTDLKLDVESGQFYQAQQKLEIVGQSAITFTSWYRNGSGGWTTVTSQTSADPDNYDDGSGTLASLPTDKWKRDTLYVSKNGDGTEYHLVYAQEYYDTQVEAESGDNPAPPNFIQELCLLVAGVVCQEGDTVITSVVDARPFLGQRASGTTAVTLHGNLTGLGSNDHIQYQLRSEKDSANGYAGLDASGDISDAVIPNTITRDSELSSHTANSNAHHNEDHASRHQHGGADEVATATPGANAIPKATSDSELAAGWLKDFVGDSGSGGTKGAVPAPLAGDAAAGKYLSADGSWDNPGDVAGPASSTDGSIARFDGTSGKVIQTSDPSIDDDGALTNVERISFKAEYDNGNSGSAKTVDWTNGQKQRITLTGDATISFTAPAGPTNLLLKIIQDGTGNREPTWPASVKWSRGYTPSLTNAASAIDIVSFYYDGTNYFGVASLDFS